MLFETSCKCKVTEKQMKKIATKFQVKSYESLNHTGKIHEFLLHGVDDMDEKDIARAERDMRDRGFYDVTFKPLSPSDKWSVSAYVDIKPEKAEHFRLHGASKFAFDLVKELRTNPDGTIKFLIISFEYKESDAIETSDYLMRFGKDQNLKGFYDIQVIKG